MWAMGEARRHLLLLLSGVASEQLESFRRQWDPVMAGRLPAHITLVYPEEVDDESVLLERVADATAEVAPFLIWLGEAMAAEEGRGGVWFSVLDPSGSWGQLRDIILAPPLMPLLVAPHATVVHPRTSDLGPEAAAELRSIRIGGESLLGEVLHTETDPTGMRILHRFPLAGPRPTQVVAGLLRRDGRMLLCHRHPARTNYPNVWDLPGGHIEAGENIADAVVRELREELGVRIDPPTGPPLAMVRVEDIEMFVYLFDRWEGELHNTATDEHDEIRWVVPDDVDQFDLAHHSYPALLRRAAQQP